MILEISLSALGISIALIGICINLLFTKRYHGGAYFSGDTSHKANMRQLKLGKAADGLVLLGTAGQLVSLFLK